MGNKEVIRPYSQRETWPTNPRPRESPKHGMGMGMGMDMGMDTTGLHVCVSLYV